MKLNEYLQKNVENNYDIFNRRFKQPYYNYNKFISDNTSMADFVSKYGLPEECDIKFINEYKTDVPDKDKDTCSAWFDSELLILYTPKNLYCIPQEIKLVFMKNQNQNNKTENNEVKTNKIEIDTIADLYRIENKKFIQNYRKGYFKGIKFVGTLKELTNILEFSDVSQLKLFDISNDKNDDYVVEVYHKYSDNKVFIWFDKEKTISNNCCTYIQGFNVNCIEDIRRIEDYRFESNPSGDLYFNGCYGDLNKLLLIELDKKDRFFIEVDEDNEGVIITDIYTHESIEIFLTFKSKDKAKNESSDNCKITIETLEDFKNLEKLYNYFFVDRYDYRKLHFKGNIEELFDKIKISKNIKLTYLRDNHPQDHLCLRFYYPADNHYSFIGVILSKHNSEKEINFLEKIIKIHNNNG